MPTQPPIIHIDLSRDIPAYRQIVDSVRALLVSGALQAGDLLPPVRQVAIDLGVHFNTVAEAYRLLADEGWLDLKRRRGAVVLSRQAPAKHDPEKLDSFSQRLRELIAELRSAGVPSGRIARELRTLAEGLER